MTRSLDGDAAGVRKRSDPQSERSDEAAERCGRHCPIDPAISFREIRVVVLTAQHDLERARTTHEAREMLNAACAGTHAEPRFRLTENRGLSRSEAHVASEHEFAAGGADASLDLRDRNETARAEMAKQEADRRFASELHRFLPVLVDLGHVDVRNEIVGIGAREDDYAGGFVRLRELNQRDQIANELGSEQIHGRSRERGEEHACVSVRLDRFEVALNHVWTSG